jgi:hypothetical protein
MKDLVAEINSVGARHRLPTVIMVPTKINEPLRRGIVQNYVKESVEEKERKKY